MTEYEKKCLTCKHNYKTSEDVPRCNCMCENHDMYEPTSKATMTDNEIIGCLNSTEGKEHIGIYCTDTSGNYTATVKLEDVVSLINRQKAQIEDLIYKLVGVMHSVDKWLDGDELKQDEVNRAATMREKTLQITEKQQAEIERLNNELNSARLFKSLYEELKAEHLETVRLIKTAETEAVKRFAEKLVALDDIEKITKEMVGE